MKAMLSAILFVVLVMSLSGCVGCGGDDRYDSTDRPPVGWSNTKTGWARWNYSTGDYED